MATGHINYGQSEPNAPAIQKAAQKAAEQIVSPNTADANKAALDVNDSWHKYSSKLVSTKIDFEKIAWVIRVCNYLLVICSVLYAMSLLFGLMISLVGKLGGISHITKAVFHFASVHRCDYAMADDFQNCRHRHNFQAHRIAGNLDYVTGYEHVRESVERLRPVRRTRMFCNSSAALGTAQEYEMVEKLTAKIRNRSID
jgi:hypothetical protein